MKSQASIDIARSIEDVFRLTNDHVVEWSNVLVEDRIVEEVDGVVGTRSVAVTEERGQRMEFDCLVTAYDPPHHSAVKLKGTMFDIVASYSFLDLGENQTRVTQESTVTGKGAMWFFFLLFGWALKTSNCDAAKKEMQSLKRFCEQTEPAKT